MISGSLVNVVFDMFGNFFIISCDNVKYILRGIETKKKKVGVQKSWVEVYLSS